MVRSQFADQVRTALWNQTMRPEIETTVGEIKESLALLRRHL